MLEDVPEGEAARNEKELLRPRVWLEAITFSDDTQLRFDQDDIVVFVGPNNAGKSAALRELETWVGSSMPGNVIKAATLHKDGSRTDLFSYLETYALKHGDPSNIQYSGLGYNIHNSMLNFYDNPNVFHQIAPFFVKRLATQNRIIDSDPAPGIALHHAPTTHPIHMLLMDDVLSKDISDMFQHAFGEDLTPFRAGGNQFPLYVGKKPAVSLGKDELSKEFVDALLNSNVTLQSQGDGMRSFASVMLHVLAAKTHTIQFLDEPEAFLHPPQARLLGHYIAKNNAGNSQLFIATHSTDILDGLIEGGADKVRIVRLRRDGNVNRVKELDKQQTASIAKDTLSRFSGVFEGIFFEHVFICESDADCMFYQSLLYLPSIYGSRRPDVHFIHAAGKHRMAKLAETLRSLDVPVSVVADIDILDNNGTFKQLFEKLGGNWTDVEHYWRQISHAVLHQRPPLNTDQVAARIRAELERVSGTEDFPDENERAIKEIFKAKSPWSVIKQSGRSGLPSGDTTTNFDNLNRLCSEHGLWIVPVGEIEGFCQTVGGHGPKFVERVLEDRDLESDEELKEAREFIARIWRRAKPPSEGTQ